MLGKLFRYDVRAQSRILLPFTAAVLVSSLLCTLAIRFVVAVSNGIASDNIILTILTTSMGILIVFNIIAVLIFPVLTTVLAMYHFYRNLYTDEGYLMFTLPVKTWELYASKFLSTLMWLTVSVLVTLSCGALMLFIGSADSGIFNVHVIEGFAEIFGELSEIFDSGALTVYVLTVYALSIISSVLYMIAVVFLSITVGSIISKRHKILASIGVYYVINLVVSSINSIISIVTLVGSSAGSETDSVASIIASQQNMGITGTIISLGFAAASCVITCHMMKNKLNLP